MTLIDLKLPTVAVKVIPLFAPSTRFYSGSLIEYVKVEVAPVCDGFITEDTTK